MRCCRPGRLCISKLNCHQQKRGWTRRSFRQEPVSIRRRRVHSPMVLEWGPKARRATALGVQFSCVACRDGSSRTAGSAVTPATSARPRGPIRADPQLVGADPVRKSRTQRSREPCNLCSQYSKVNAALAGASLSVGLPGHPMRASHRPIWPTRAVALRAAAHGGERCQLDSVRATSSTRLRSRTT